MEIYDTEKLCVTCIYYRDQVVVKDHKDYRNKYKVCIRPAIRYTDPVDGRLYFADAIDAGTLRSRFRLRISEDFWCGYKEPKYYEERP